VLLLIKHRLLFCWSPDFIRCCCCGSVADLDGGKTTFVTEVTAFLILSAIIVDGGSLVWNGCYEFSIEIGDI